MAIVTLKGLKAQRLSDLALLLRDLRLANACLQAINATPDITAREGLWHAAIINFGKFFAGGRRFRPDPYAIYSDEATDRRAYRWFDKLRDNHIAHDENVFAQSIPAAILNDGTTKGFKVEKVVCLSTFNATLTQENWSKLVLLIDGATKWTSAQVDSVCDSLTKDLEAEPYSSLIARKPVAVRIAVMEDMEILRPRVVSALPG